MWTSPNQRPYLRVTSQRLPIALAREMLVYGRANATINLGLPQLVAATHTDVYTIQLNMRTKLRNISKPGIPRARQVLNVREATQ